MKRQDKYPDTDTFTFYNANPYKRFSGDCVVRAICTALNQSWEQTVQELTTLGVEKGYVLNDPHLFPIYLAQKGFVKHKQPRKESGAKYTGNEFCKHIAGNNPIVANIGRLHTVAILNKKILDIWDSSSQRIGIWWELPKEA